MKLLGWMHRKFRQNNTGEPFKDFGIGNACNCLSGRPSLDEQHLGGPKSNLYSRPSLGSNQKDRTFRKSFAGLEEEDEEEDQTLEDDEILHGLLAIGTLGSDPVETITEKQTEVTANDLRLINDELEKVLGMETRDEFSDVSARNSHVSVVANGGRQSTETSSEGNGTVVCPLQGYLFGSPIELGETETGRGKKEQRTSLGELFLKTRAEEKAVTTDKWKCEREEKEKSGVHLMKKMLKRRTASSSSGRNSSAAASAAPSPDSVSAENKLHKILQIFHRKVHPESPTGRKKNKKFDKYEMKNNIPYNGSEDHGEQYLHDHETTLAVPQRANEKERIQRYRSRSNMSSFELSSGDSNGNREHWIKTDADYLVLEL